VPWRSAAKAGRPCRHRRAELVTRWIKLVYAAGTGGGQSGACPSKAVRFSVPLLGAVSEPAWNRLEILSLTWNLPPAVRATETSFVNQRTAEYTALRLTRHQRRILNGCPPVAGRPALAGGRSKLSRCRIDRIVTRRLESLPKAANSFGSAHPWHHWTRDGMALLSVDDSRYIVRWITETVGGL